MIYSEDGTPLFQPHELERHHPFCNFFFKPRANCKQCVGLYYQWPVKPGETDAQLVARWFPGANTVDTT